MVFYIKQKVSSCEIAGAVAAAALHDLRVNLFAFTGFPQISVGENSETEFKITLGWKDHGGELSEVTFPLSHEKAFAAAKSFKKSTTHDGAIFEAVQEALAKLEGQVSRARSKST